MNKIDYDSLPKDFLELYTKELDVSLSLGSLWVEGYKLYGDDKTIYNMMTQDSALQYAKELIDPSRNGDRFYKYELVDGTIEIAKRISNKEINGFRIRPIEVIGSNVERADAYMINSYMVGAYDDYLYFLNELNNKKYDISDDEYDRLFFENEARLHIRLLHIHPFEDYNGRTMRTILTVNLLKNCYAPVIINPKIKKKYNKYIENNDVLGFGEFLRLE